MSNHPKQEPAHGDPTLDSSALSPSNGDQDETENILVRTFHSDDQSQVVTLYTDGLLAGQIAANDTGADIDNLHEAYFSDDRHHFWVAEQSEQVLGMIGVSSDDQNTAEVRRLRVDQGHQDSPIPGLLLQKAVEFCREKEYLKVRLDTRFEKTAALDLFDRTGFQHTRTRKSEDKELLEFYVDLYRPVKDEENTS